MAEIKNMDDDFSKKEEEILKFWEENKVFDKIREKNKGNEKWSFLDGPITANNPMGVHHAWGRTYKDLFQRYKALRGFEQRFQNGFDCQGLWVEVEVEKELGFKNKKDIEALGIDNFVQKCKERVKKYSEIQTKQSIRLGQFMDWENSYYTMSEENNYAIWGFLKKCHQKGLLYKGKDVVPWCPRCLDGDSKILLDNGISKNIKELSNSWKENKVVGFADKKNEITAAPIVEYISNPKELVFKLTTLETGRSILATADHPFWVKGKGWVVLSEINANEKIAVYPHSEVIEDNYVKEQKILDEKVLKNIVTELELKRGKKIISDKISNYRDLITLDKWSLDEKIQSLRAQNYTIRQVQNEILLKQRVNTSFNAICYAGNIKNKNCTLEYVIRELRNKNLLFLTTKNEKLPIIARLLGHIFGDGFLVLGSGKRKNLSVGFTGNEEDLNEIKKDLDKLGFNYTSTCKRLVTSKLKDRIIRGYSTEFRVHSTSLAVLLLTLGAPIGKKSEYDYNVPKWLLKAPKHIKREFLAAYFGSELTKIKINRGKFDALVFSLYKNEKLSKSGHNFINGISNLLKEFNVKIQNIRCRDAIIRSNNSKSVRFDAVFSQSFDNLLNFCKFIGYRYSKEREEMARYAQEYLEIRDKLKKKKIEEYKKVFKLKRKGMVDKEISKKLFLSKRKVEEILQTKLCNIKVNNFPDFNKWFKKATDNHKNQFIWETVEEIKKHGKRNVFDFSVNPLHSFIANGFVVHNCGTAISQHEISVEEYKEITHKSVFLKIPLLNKENVFFLVWTTTPWTLPANVSLAVNPDIDYVEIEKEKETFILAKSKISLVEGKTIREFKGKEIEGQRYKGIFDELSGVELKEDDHRIVLWKEVTEDEGTGIVHIATGCGEEDYALGKELNLSVVNPLNDESRYKEGFGFLEGKLATEANESVFENLEKKNFIYKIEDYKHRYPVCWRCKSELIFRLVDEWYISMDKIRGSLIEAAKKINWIPSFGLEREVDWLMNMKDWLISKKRYWGLALPIFECEKCKEFEVIGSKEELKERAIENWDQFEGKTPHRPFVDNIKLECKSCKGRMSRIIDVGNPWLDAGIVPFSTMGYFKDKSEWEKWFPADLVCESFPGQFKNWFYSIIVMSVVLEDKQPVRTIFGFALVKDEKGEEMHKSKGNAIWLNEAIEKIGADPMRWMYARQNPANNLKFGFVYAEEIKRKLLTLLNVLSFFTTYADKKDFESYFETYFPSSKNILDKWIISRFQNLLKKTQESFDKYDAMTATLSIENFFINDLSLWYVRRSRKRIQEEKEGRETLFYILLNLTKLISPIAPFLAENIYSQIKAKDMPISVHLLKWPFYEQKEIDLELEEKMDYVRKVVGIALSLRADAKIKVRQPLGFLKIKNKKIDEKELVNLIKEEVNVKEVLFEDMDEEVKLSLEITEELKKEGIDRELIRNVNLLRKKHGFTPKDEIDVSSSLDISNKDKFKKETKARELKIAQEIKEDKKAEIKIDGRSYFIGIKKV